MPNAIAIAVLAASASAVPSPLRFRLLFSPDATGIKSLIKELGSGTMAESLSK